MELEALQRQFPKGFDRKARMLTPNLSPLGFINDMLAVVKVVNSLSFNFFLF